jgi:predicted Rossmann fold flavoprotein
LKRIAVIGGGASGLMAACHAAGEGRNVVLFEKQKKLGRKILATGNGRCNITNRNLDPGRYHGENPKIAHSIFSKFGYHETEEFFLSIGLPLAEGRNGRMYPSSFQASSVVNLLLYRLKRAGVTISLHRKIEEVISEKGQFRLVTAGREEQLFDSVILASGSCSYPQLGGNRSGYEIAERLGHTLIEPFPSILPINIPLKPVHRLQGIKWDCRVDLLLNGKRIVSSTDELLFTGYGLSGIAALDISRWVNKFSLEGKDPEISIDFFPGLNEDELEVLLERLWEDKSKKLAFSLYGILKERIPEIVLESAGFDTEKKTGSLKVVEKKQIAHLFKNFKLKPGKPRSFNEAVVAAGGVNVDEIDPATMESKLAKNLFITGELLDIDADSGGYNLQFAWSTGAIAGMSQ